MATEGFSLNVYRVVRVYLSKCVPQTSLGRINLHANTLRILLNRNALCLIISRGEGTYNITQGLNGVCVGV